MNSRGQNGEAGIHYVQATEVRSFPENKHRDPIQVMKGFDIFASRERKCQPRSQGLSSLPPLSLTMEAEKTDPGNEVEKMHTLV